MTIHDKFEPCSDCDGAGCYDCADTGEQIKIPSQLDEDWTRADHKSQLLKLVDLHDLEDSYGNTMNTLRLSLGAHDDGWICFLSAPTSGASIFISTGPDPEEQVRKCADEFVEFLEKLIGLAEDLSDSDIPV
jgi:hypothetical protein